MRRSGRCLMEWVAWLMRETLERAVEEYVSDVWGKTLFFVDDVSDTVAILMLKEKQFDSVQSYVDKRRI